MKLEKVVRKRHIVLEDFVDPEVDKPLEKDEKLNLEEFISAHNQAAESPEHIVRPKVEMIDFADIDDMREEAESAASSADKADPAPYAKSDRKEDGGASGSESENENENDFDALIEELLNSETYSPEKKRRR